VTNLTGKQGVLNLLEETMLYLVPETDWAWLAGAVDSEGHIRIYKQRRSDRISMNYCANFRYYVDFDIYNTDSTFMEKVVRITLGKKSVIRKAGVHNKTLYGVYIGRQEHQLYILRRILSYLTKYKSIAELAIRFLEAEKLWEKETIYEEYTRLVGEEK
jgi:hypothetical protein